MSLLVGARFFQLFSNDTPFNFSSTSFKFSSTNNFTSTIQNKFTSTSDACYMPQLDSKQPEYTCQQYPKTLINELGHWLTEKMYTTAKNDVIILNSRNMIENKCQIDNLCDKLLYFYLINQNNLFHFQGETMSLGKFIECVYFVYDSKPHDHYQFSEILTSLIKIITVN